MTDPTSPPEPPHKPPAAPRRIVRAEQDHPANAEPAGRDRQHVGQRVLEQRPHERRPSDNTAARGAKPDLRDLPPPRRDTPANVWRADPPPRPRQDGPRAADPRDRREGPRREYGDAPRPDRAGERRSAPATQRPNPPWPAQQRPDAQRPPMREDQRRATGTPPGPPRERTFDDRRAPYPAERGDRPRYQGPRDDRRGGAGAPEGGRPPYHGPRDDLRGMPGSQGGGPRAPQAERRPPYPQGPNERSRHAGPQGPADRPPRRRDDFEPPRPAAAGAPAPQQPAFDPTAPRREDQRLSKVLAERGIASRREADDWIDAGWVKVDGEPAVLGARVFPHQTIEIDPLAKTQQAHRVTILLHKPIGYVSGQAEDGYEPASVLVTADNHWAEDPSRERWHPGHARGIAPAGRLDIDSTGLLVLTQDGRIARHLIGEDSDVEKEYLVRVEYPRGGMFPDDDLERLRHGLWLDGKELRPAKVSWANEDQLRFVLREGRKRQIRRMCEAVGLVVTGLKRVRIGSVVLGKLPPGQWRYLREDERF